MSHPARQDATQVKKLVVVLVWALALVIQAQAQPFNSWTNPASASWQSPAWSLGVLPASHQTINLTNEGYKAVGIDSVTVADFAASLTISNLVISAPTNGLSTLLLNYAGNGIPFRVLNGCVISTNGTLANFESDFEVDCTNGGELLVDGGTYVQQSGQALVNGPVEVRNNGVITTTNANLTLGPLNIGAAPDSFGTFVQNGGSIAAQHVYVSGFSSPAFGQGGYELVSGVLYAIEGTQCSASGPAFRQFGGTNFGNINVTAGAYSLLSGMAQGNVLNAGSVRWQFHLVLSERRTAGHAIHQYFRRV